MASDGRIRIDIDMAIDKIMADADKVDKRLQGVGQGTGDQLSEDFDANAEKVSDKSGSTAKKVKNDFSDPVKQSIEGDDSNLSEKVANAKASLEKLPDETLTELKAEAEDAGITDFDALLEALPEEEITELLAKAEKGEVVNFNDLLNSLPEETRTELLAKGNTKPITTFDELLDEVPEETRTALKAKAERGEITSFDELLAELPEETRTELKAKAERGEIRSFDELLGTLPKRTITRLTADAQAHGINNFDKLLNKLPKKTVTELLAKAEKGEVINYEKLLHNIPAKYVTNLELNDNASSGLHNIQDEAEETKSKFSNLKEIIGGSFIGNAAASGLQKVGGYLTSLVGEAENASDAMQGFEATMQLAGFGKDKIKAVGKEVKQYADETVYDLKDVSSTTAQLGANGVKNFEKLTEAAGNLTAVAGGTKDDFKSVAMVMTQTAGAGKLTTENWNQLTDAIPGASGKLQEAMKKNGAFTGNFRDAMEDGQISADEFNQAIKDLGMTDKAKEYAKGTAAFEGAFGNVESTVVNGIQAMIDAIGKKNITNAINSMAGVAKKGFGVLVNMIDKVKSKSAILGLIGSRIAYIAKIFGKEIWKQIKNIFSDLVNVFGKLTGKSKAMKDPLAAISNALLDIGKHRTAIKRAADALMILFAVKKAKQFLGVIGSIPKKFIDAKNAIKTFGGFAKKAGSGIGKALKWTAKVTAGPAKKVVGGLGKAFRASGRGVKKAITWSAKVVTSAAKKTVSGLGKVLKASGRGIKKAITYTAHVATKGAKLAMKGLVGAAKATGRGLRAAFNFLKANPFILLASAIAAVVVGFIELYKHNKKFRKFVNGIVKSAKKIFKGVTKWFGKMYKGAVKHVKNLWNGTKKHFSNGWNAVKKGTKNGKKAIVSHFNSMKKSAVKHAKNLWSSTKRHFSKGWSNIKRASKAGGGGVRGFFNTMRKGSINQAKNMWRSTKKHFSRGWSAVKKSSRDGRSAVAGYFNNMKKRSISAAKSMWSTAKRDFRNGAKTNKAITKTMKDVVSGHWGRLGKDISRIGGSIKKGAHDHFKGMYDSLNKLTGGGLGKLTKAFSGFGKGVKGIFKSIKKSIKKHVKNGINGAIGFINGGIGGINKVIHTFGGSKHALGKIKKLANGGSGYRGVAMVNDGGGEEAILKGGKAYKVQGKNALINLEGNETVVPHGASRGMFGSSIAHYKGGSDNWFSNLTGWFKDKWDGIVNFIKHPIKSLKTITSKAMGKVTGSKFITNFTPATNKAFVNGIWKQFKKMLQDLKTAHDDVGGSFDGKMGAHGVYAYLWNIAKKAMKKFGMVYTSGYRPGKGSYHGKHQAVDIAFPGVSHSSRYWKPANWVFDHFKKQIGYVITQGKIKTRGSKFNGLGEGANRWTPWRDHDHYDHLHINGMWGPGDVGTGGGGHVSGSHSHWLKQAGFKPSEINAANWLVSKESGWRTNATNPSSGAYGLAQALPASKYNSQGSDWRNNPLTQLKWMAKYVHGRYGSAQAAKRFHLSHNWYDNGGYVTKPTVGVIAEKNGERIINSQRDSADGLIMDAMNERAAYAPNSLSGKISRIVKGAQASNGTMIQPTLTKVGENVGRESKAEQPNIDGDISINVNLDSQTIGRATYPTTKAMMAGQLSIVNNGGSIPNGGVQY